MTIISLITHDQQLTAALKPTIASGDINSVLVQVDFDEIWGKYTKSAVFFTAKNKKPYEILLSADNSCVVPHEVLAESGTLYIGIRGVNAAKTVKTSTLVKLKIDEGAPVGIIEEPTLDIYMQLFNFAREANAAAKEVRDGLAPYIGANGTWWVGDTDTGVIAGTPTMTFGTDLMVAGESYLRTGMVYFLCEGEGIPTSNIYAIKYGTDDLAAGETALETGTIYFKVDGISDDDSGDDGGTGDDGGEDNTEEETGSTTTVNLYRLPTNEDGVAEGATPEFVGTFTTNKKNPVLKVVPNNGSIALDDQIILQPSAGHWGVATSTGVIQNTVLFTSSVRDFDEIPIKELALIEGETYNFYAYDIDTELSSWSENGCVIDGRLFVDEMATDFLEPYIDGSMGGWLYDLYEYDNVFWGMVVKTRDGHKHWCVNGDAKAWSGNIKERYIESMDDTIITINDKTIYVPYGFTWKNFADCYVSDDESYELKYSVTGNGTIKSVTEEAYITDASGNLVKSTETITAGAYYCREEAESSRTVTFSIYNSIFGDGEYTVSDGTTWGEWVETTYCDEEGIEDYEWKVSDTDNSIIHGFDSGYLIDANGNQVYAETVIVAGTYTREA